MKLQLEKLFISHLKTESNSIRHNQITGLLEDMKVFTRGLENAKTESTKINHHLEIKPIKVQSKEIIDLLVFSKSNLLEKLTENVKLGDFSTLNNKSCSDDDSLKTTGQTIYLLFFMITYLQNLHKRLEEKLQDNFGSDWRGKNIWFGVSVEKYLLDNVFGSKKNLEKLFFASGILGKDNNLRKAQFCTFGEEILPALQQELKRDLNLKMKSYFVAAHIYSRYIQLTLHQVVKLELSGKKSATIIIQDKIIHINDVYDTLCKGILANMQSYYRTSCCSINNHNTNEQYDLSSLKIYSNICQKLKLSIVELVS